MINNDQVEPQMVKGGTEWPRIDYEQLSYNCLRDFN